jgi:DNA-directed RNA polymerase subunit H
VSTRLNVLDHTMVPRHQIMSEEEVTGLLKRYNISNDQLPKMYHDDPAAKTIEAKPGDVIQIIRTSQTAGRAESYRLVVRRPKK